MDYYKAYISQHEDWELYKVYADKGISGTSTKNRTGFNQMIKAGLSGSFDIIITKSISRFARNTLDTVQYVRKLKKANCFIYFEKENLWSSDDNCELILTIMACIAQEESRSISQSVSWGIKRKMEEGRFSMPYKSVLGFDKGPDGMPIINEKEAFVIRRMYAMIIEGMKCSEIAKELTREGIKTPMGNDIWNESSIRQMLKNEKYKGDALLQKTYTVDPLTHEKKDNHGEKNQYYVVDSHKGIIDKETFDKAQVLLSKNDDTYTFNENPLRLKFRCESCGHYYGKRKWHPGTPSEKIVYGCSNNYKKHLGCNSPFLYESDMEYIMDKIVSDILNEYDITNQIDIAIRRLKCIITGYMLELNSIIDERNYKDTTDEMIKILSSRKELIISKINAINSDIKILYDIQDKKSISRNERNLIWKYLTQDITIYSNKEYKINFAKIPNTNDEILSMHGSQ